MAKRLLLSVTADDCRWDYYRGSGKGGQKKNKTSSAVRCSHLESGAVGQAEDGRSQRQNKKLAFKRMADTEDFKKWIKLEGARALGVLNNVEEKVEEQMHPKNILVEIKKDGRWVKE